MPVDATTLVEWFEKSWNEAYHTPVARALEGLTAAQAFWKPAPERHSAWQQVMHMAYWREYFIRALEGNPAFPAEADLQANNWPPHPEPADDAAWAAARSRLEATQQRLVKLLRAMPPERLERPAWGGEEPVALAIVHYMRHDSYHLGQIMLLRGLQGLPPLD
ncbi:DinB family protein [Carboxydochorda subterranea]|uniref:DinB family protein n=1 Tax=Carboxydichorda subterranea TaxID=3109565 RepID=A0ABZ1BT90_9FIRM|nr:DinB family protein [Limnochorda sp. L945t]WRP16016.1 DinB family protein [Limnochorda sp. L945t]